MTPQSMAASLALLLFQVVGLQHRNPSFTLDQAEVTAGGSANLNWTCPMATKTYVSSVGIINNPTRGSIVVKPNETTDYILITEAPDAAPVVLSQRLVVRGAKGSSGEWPDAYLPLASNYEYKIAARSMVEMAERVRTVLQDQLKFEVRQFSPADGQVVLFTAFSQRPELSPSSENPRRIRQIAYRVNLYSTRVPRSIQLGISATIKWRGVIDNRWFPESSSLSIIYQNQIAALRTAITGN